MTPFLRRPTLLLCVIAAALSGCGGGTSGRPNESATLVLDFTPNAVHSGIYLALARGYDAAEGVDLTVQEPSSSTDSVKLLLGGRAKFAILDIHDLAIAREKGRDLVGVMAVVERPLAAVIAQPDVAGPAALAGHRVGVSGLPSDNAVLDSIVSGAGGDPKRVKRVTIGFDAVKALLARRVAGATAFWNAEGVALQERRPGMKIFQVDDYGAPPYPELVLTATRQTVTGDPRLVRATVAALQRGYRATILDPESSVQALVSAVPEVDAKLAQSQLDAVSGSLQASDGTVGTLAPATLRAWAAWEQRFGIVRSRPDVARGFAPAFAAAGAKRVTADSG